jgi:hypothetical protein
MRVLTGIFRYVRLQDVADRMAQGWRYAGDLGQPHGNWSVLMWFCCGDCSEHEVP